MSPTDNDSPVSDDYFLEIESHFAERRGTPFVFSAKDWALMKAWQEDGVPLPVVIEAIDRCFESRAAAGRRRGISSLSYCRHAVRDLWEERKDLGVGAAGTAPETDVAARIAELADRLEGSASANEPPLAEPIAAAAALVRSIAIESLPKIEERLLEIEEAMMNDLRAALTPIEAESMKMEIERDLAGHRMDDGVAERTRAANLRRIIRSRLSIPRLSLLG